MLAFIIATLVGIALVVLTIFSQVALWQRKEYRLDRMLAYVQSDEWIQTYGWLLLAIAILSNAGWYAFFVGSPLVEPIGWLELSILVFFHVQRISSRGVYRPKITAKSGILMIMVTLVAFLLIALLYEPGLSTALQWSTFVWLVPVIAAPCVWLVNGVTNIRKQQIISKAKHLRGQLPELKVIGITGSYGKTSTKYFLSQILTAAGSKFLVTAEHRNSELAVAQDMLARLKKGIEMYVVEMGAYRLGEINALVKLTKPQAGVVTAIGNQHVALFGSRQKLTKAKWELIKGLPKDGMAILNADDEIVARMGAKTKKDILWYSSSREAGVCVSNLTIEPESFTGTFNIDGMRKRVAVPLASEAMLSSVLAAIAGAYALGVSKKEILDALPKLKPMSQTMEVLKGKKGSTVIDDSYSANEFGVVAALNHLNRFAGKKAVIMTPIIELGEESWRAHERIGRVLKDLDATVIVYGTAYSEAIIKGLAKSKQAQEIEFISQPDVLVTRARELAVPGAAILLEGRLPNVVRQELLASRP